MRSPFLRGVLATLLGGAVIGVAVAWLVIWSGVVSVAATRRGGWLDRALDYASTRSIRHHAKDEKNPLAGDPRALNRGLAHYREMCVGCHGAPGRAPDEFAQGLNPSPPDLASAEAQAATDGMLYETISSGIRSTGMPAFASTHRPDEIWSIVAFVRHLPALTGAESESLGHGPSGRTGERPRAPAERPAGGAAKPGEHTHEVSLTRFSFVPAALTVSQGDTVVFTNRDFVAHTATAKDGTFDTGKLDAGQSKRIVADRKGTFPYFCRFHPRMTGTLTVQ
jgi:plastocyanin/mono/diheme cytochrome c family protein